MSGGRYLAGGGGRGAGGQRSLHQVLRQSSAAAMSAGGGPVATGKELRTGAAQQPAQSCPHIPMATASACKWLPCHSPVGNLQQLKGTRHQVSWHVAVHRVDSCSRHGSSGLAHCQLPHACVSCPFIPATWVPTQQRARPPAAAGGAAWRHSRELQPTLTLAAYSSRCSSVPLSRIWMVGMVRQKRLYLRGSTYGAVAHLWAEGWPTALACAACRPQAAVAGTEAGQSWPQSTSPALARTRHVCLQTPTLPSAALPAPCPVLTCTCQARRCLPGYCSSASGTPPAREGRGQGKQG